MSDTGRPKPAGIGLRDRVFEGWFNNETGELIRGVRVHSTDTVIDVGCGDGGFIGFCAGRGAEVIFVDINEEKVRLTERRIEASPAHAYRAIVSDCSPIPIDNDTGDLVICTEVLEHVLDPRDFLAELIRITRPGGRLLLTVPDARSEAFVAATAPPQYFQEPNHIRVFSEGEFEALVRGAGLEVESHQFMGCFWSVYWPLAWLTCEAGEGLPLDNPHPITDHWTRLWAQVQEHPGGTKIRDALNTLLPKSQSIVARKPL